MKKTLLIVVALALVVSLAIGGTYAWLTDKESVTNTFTVGNIDIDLDETTGDEYKMVPGTDLAKDPKITVEKGSEPCWLFAQLVEENGKGPVSGKELLSYTVRDPWKLLDGTTNVYYTEVDASAASADIELYVLTGKGEGDLKNGFVTISEDMTKGDMDAIAESEKYPTLTVTAYAIQKYGFTTAAAAWVEAQKA